MIVEQKSSFENCHTKPFWQISWCFLPFFGLSGSMELVSYDLVPYKCVQFFFPPTSFCCVIFFWHWVTKPFVQWPPVDSPFVTTVPDFLSIFPHFSGSVYSVIAVAFERFYNICKPFSRNLVRQQVDKFIFQHIFFSYFQGSVLDGHGYIITIIIFSILYNIIKFFEFETVTAYYEDDITGEM